MADKGTFYERVKKNDIYPRWFPPGVKMEEFEFRKAVQKAYDEIIILIPELNGKGNSNEDYYMAEWLHGQRQEYPVVAQQTMSELASLIYQIR